MPLGGGPKRAALRAGQQKARRSSEISERRLLEFGFGKPRQENGHAQKSLPINMVSAVRGQVSDEDKKLIKEADDKEQAQ